jgi:hypothetical protein
VTSWQILVDIAAALFAFSVCTLADGRHLVAR